MNTLLESYKDYHINLHHIIPLDFDSIQEVSDVHSWPQSNDFLTLDLEPNDKSAASIIPIIDFSDPNVSKLIGQACETWGSFQLINHNVPLNLIESAESEARKLFSLPTSEKRKTLRSPSEATGYGLARMSQFFSRLLWQEGFTIMGSPVDHAKKLWPDDYQRFCDVIEDFQDKLKALSEQLMLIILDYLGIPKEEMKWVGSNSGPECATSALQMNSYPPCPDPTLTIGLAPHTDTYFLTILHQTSNPTRGLEIHRDGLGWVSVNPVHGALVVNAGDLLHIASNGRFPSVLHRAVVNKTNHRLSLAYFYGPPMNYQLLPSLAKLDDDDPSVYPSLKVKDYVTMKEKHFRETLSMLKL
ncbi:Isopenicillin N synthase-like, Fe(2+) 2OG dioxygenase domain [Dillenia turbinata]|uniref:gibberellin 3beta-dioxygenase n=1 Tax=Dillenia turbinata TaxID=194707 RepID=A0AAN8ULL1_9MAGN